MGKYSSTQEIPIPLYWWYEDLLQAGAEKPETTFPRHLSTSGFSEDLATLAVCKKEWRKKCLNPVLGYVLSYDRKFGDRVRKMGV